MICPHCAQPNRDGARFCDSCGRSLLEERHAPDPSAVVPPHLARRILQERAAMQGERRIVTVLFADAVGSTNLGERLDEEEVYSIVQQSVARMMEAVHRQEGSITQFRGDGVMALFGAPIAHEDSARRAVLAGLEMQRALAGYAVEVKSRHGVELAFRVGLHTGPVVVGAISDSLVMDYTAVGDTANLAARMEGLAEPGSVYMTEETWKQVRDYIDCEPRGAHTVKGKAEPVQVFKAKAPRQIRSRLEAAAERGLSPFSGRSDELQQLLGLFAQARGGRGCGVLVTADAGLGKSRLLRELHVAVGEQATWLEGRCSAIGRSTPYLPIIEIVRQAIGATEQDGAPDVAARVDDRAGTWPEAERTTVPLLKFLLRADTGDARVERMDPAERQFAVFDAIADLVRREAATRPLVMVVEDLHWVDEQSDRALARLVERVEALPVLLVITTRPGQAPSFATRLHALPLSRLGDEDAARIARAALRADALPAELVDVVLRKAEGNPFYVEEVTHALIETGVLRREGDGFVLAQPLDRLRLPLTIQEIILGRIDRLEREAREVLQLASVIGREFTLRLLERIAELRARLGDCLGELEALELVFSTAAWPDPAYLFKHALTHEVAYSTLLVERRRALHRAVAAAMEEIYGDRLNEHWGVLAHHHELAEDWARALPCLLRAGEKAARDCANRVALDLYDRAVGAAERLGPDGVAQLIVALRGSGAARLILGEPSAATADFERLRQVAAAAGDLEGEAAALVYLATIALYAGAPAAEETLREALALAGGSLPSVRGTTNAMLALLLYRAGPERHAEGKDCLREAVELVDQIQEPLGRAYTAMMSIMWPGWLGRFDEAVSVAARLGPIVEERGIGSFKTNLRWARGLVLAGRGEYSTAFHELEQALAVCERFGDAMVMGRCLNSLGWIHHDLGDHERAIELNRRCLDVTALRDLEVACNARLNLADALAALGRLDEADREYGEVEERARAAAGSARKMVWRYSQHLFHGRGELWLRRGDVTGALGYADRCLDLAERSASAKYVVMARRLRALALLAGGRPEEAASEVETALAAARAVANPPQLWRTLAAAGRVRAARGDEAGAHAAWTEGAALVERVAAGLDAERASVLRRAPFAVDLRRQAGAAD